MRRFLRPPVILLTIALLFLTGLSVTSLFAQSPSSVHFAAIGDYGDGSSAETDVANLINSWNPDFIITLGDNRYGNTNFDDTVGQYFCDHLKDAGSGSGCSGGNATTNAFFPSAGNHDYTDGGGVNEYLSYFTLPGSGVTSTNTSGNERYYDFVQGPVHFFVIDSQWTLTSGSSMTDQKNWLQAQMAASTADWKIVYLHHAPYSSSTTHGSTPSMQWPYAAWGADAVLAGHDHTYERIERDGILYFVNGLGGRSIYGLGSGIAGSQVRYNGDYGAMLIDADSSQVNFKFINRSGKVIDNYTLTASGGGTATPTATTPGHVEVAVSQGSDDVEQLNGNGSMYLDSTDLELVDDPGFNGNDQSVGLRFASVPVPAGVSITDAHIEFVVDEATSGATSLTIHGQAADNPGTYSLTAYDLTNRPNTSAAVAWPNVPAWNTIGQIQQTPNLAAIVQELVNRPGWSSGNAMAFVIQGTGTRTAEAFEGTTAPRLIIDFATTPVPTNTPGPTNTPAPTSTPITPSPTPTVDPNVCVTLIADADSYINQDKNDENKGTDDELRTKTQSDKLTRPVLQFDVSAIPSGATISDATLSLWVTDVKNNGSSVSAYLLDQSWTETGVTWNDRNKNSNLAWTNAGGTYSTLIDTQSIGDPENRWVTWDVDAAVTAWVNGSNNGLILVAPVNGNRPELKFSSREENGEQPRLAICYTTGPTATPTATPVPPTPTNTPVPPTPTNTPTPAPPTATPTNTPIPTATTIPTNTPIPTATPIPTNTPVPPTPTNTPVPPTPTATPVATPIPPTCTTYVAGMDSYIDQDKPNDNKGDDDDMRIKTSTAKERRVLVWFDTGSLPSGVTVNSATMSLFVEGEKNLPLSVSAYPLTQSWVEYEVAWEDRDENANLAWSSPGGSYTIIALDSVSIVAKDVRYDWNVTSAAADWVSGASANNGFILIAPTGGNSEVKFTAIDDGKVDRNPELEICYQATVAANDSAETDTAANVAPLVLFTPALAGVALLGVMPLVNRRQESA